MYGLSLRKGSLTLQKAGRARTVQPTVVERVELASDLIVYRDIQGFLFRVAALQIKLNCFG